jgi:hypothetical protein
MNRKSASVKNVLAALPAVQAAIREDISARIAAGETIVSDETPEIAEILKSRRAGLDKGQAVVRKISARKSAA